MLKKQYVDIVACVGMPVAISIGIYLCCAESFLREQLKNMLNITILKI